MVLLLKQGEYLYKAVLEGLRVIPGSKWILELSLMKDEAGNFMMSRSTLFNITDRKRVEEKTAAR